MATKTRFRSPYVKELVSSISKSPPILDIQDVAGEIRCIFEEYADFFSGTYLANLIKLEVPKDWHEKCLTKAISTGNYFNAISVLSILDRALSQEEIAKLIEQVVLVGDMEGLYQIEKFSTETFHLALWQNIMLFRTVRLMWEKRNQRVSYLSTITAFSKEYKSTINEFDVHVLSAFRFNLTQKTFQCFDQNTMSQVLHQLLSLDPDPFIRKLAIGIKNNSAVG